jgi:hypothetical protein
MQFVIVIQKWNYVKPSHYAEKRFGEKHFLMLHYSKWHSNSNPGAFNCAAGPMTTLPFHLAKKCTAPFKNIVCILHHSCMYILNFVV